MRRKSLLCLWLAGGMGLPLAGPIVITDEPYKLVVQIDAPKPMEITGQVLADETGMEMGKGKGAGHGGGSQWQMAGFTNVAKAGYPDIPAWHFQVLTHTPSPDIQVQILETELLPGKTPVAPVALWTGPQKFEIKKDEAAFARARGHAVYLHGISQWRGAPMLSGSLPLMWLDPEGKPVGYIRRARVMMTWPKTSGGGGLLPAAIAEKVLNPRGGGALWSPKKPALAKRSAFPTPSANLIRIRIGDGELDRFEEDGFHALTYATLAARGLAIPGVRWSEIRLYTGPKDTLFTRMDTAIAPWPTTLREVPIEVVDDGNGVFDEKDTLKFFGHGTSVWKRVSDSTRAVQYEFGTDPYSFDNFYFLDMPQSGSLGQDTPLRMQTRIASPASGAVDRGLNYLRAEKDQGTIFCDLSDHQDSDPGFVWHWFWRGKCGDGGYGPVTFSASQISRPHLTALPGYAGDSVYLGFSPYQGFGGDEFELRLKGQSANLPFLNWEGRGPSWYATPGDLPQGQLEWDKVVWNGGNRRFDGYTVAYKQRYAFSGQPFWIFPQEVGKPQSYRIAGNAPYRVLKVEGGLARLFIQPASDGTFSDSLAEGSDGRYLVFSGTLPIASGALQADNAPAAGTAIRDLTTGDGQLPQNLIITADALLPVALEYRAYRSSSDRAMPLKSAVVRMEDIYRQFSGGRKTPVALRDFLRWAFYAWDSRGPSQNPLRFVTLLGDGHYDLRNIKDGSSSASNFIPPFEDFDNTRDAIASDDFFVKLEPEDLTNYFTVGANGLLDLAIGRIPARSLEEARHYLNKVRDYENPGLGGPWRSRVALTADDHIQRGAPEDLDPITSGHTNDTERLGFIIQSQDPGVVLDKVYLLDYAINTAGRKPEAAQDLLDVINRGTLAVNYVGHGAFNQWADEVLLYTNDALPKLRNVGRATLLNSFSCTVGRFDNLQNDVLTEQFVRQKEAGAIAGISATRESYPGPNLALARGIYARIFPPDSVDGLMPLGVALQDMKNQSRVTTSNGVNDSKYVLLGDPALLMRRTKLRVQLEKRPDTLSALDCGKIEGRIAGGTGNGFVHIQFLSGTIRKDYFNLGIGMEPQYQDKRGSILYERTIPYSQGRFSADYFVPKKIPYGDTTAQILIYAWDGTKEAEGSLAVKNLRIQGTATQSACAEDSDGKGPRIRISGCDASETGNVDFPDAVRVTLPYCFGIEVEDSTGGVMSGEGPDEGTTLEIPGVLDPFHPQPGVDNLFSKNYRHSLGKTELMPGTYQLRVAAQDGYGNASQRSLRMEVVRDTLAATLAAFNIPNPMKTRGTTFYFASGLPADDGEYLPVTGTVRLDYQVKIFDQRGRLVQVLKQAKAEGTPWNGRDAFGNRLANGVYTYVVTATYNPGDGSGKKYQSSKRNTLVISR